MTFKEFRSIVQAGKEAKIESSGMIYKFQRWLSAIISWNLIKIFPKIQANHVSIFNIILIWFVFIFSFWVGDLGRLIVIIIQLILLSISSLIDKIDGEIARYRKNFTQAGIYFDITYHFFYVFVFYFVIGYFFFFVSANIYVLLFSIWLGILMTYQKMLGKLRHHIKYKIELESHSNLVRDLNVASDQKTTAKIVRLFYYLFFLIYDWTWLWFLLLTVLSKWQANLAYSIYIIHIFVSLIWVIKIILIDHPRRGLYSRLD